MRLFYDPHIDANADQHQLSEEESKHIIRVLRMNANDELIVVDGKGGQFHCVIKEPNPKRCLLTIVNHTKAPESNYSIHIAVSPTKQLDRMEWFIEKATEIGATEFSFIQCKNSERVKMKMDRLEKKAISAMKQSKRLFLPTFNDLTSFDAFIKEHPNGLLAHCYEGQLETIATAYQQTNCPILIGPEGDFTPEEVAAAAKSGYKFVTLGENRLRTETAALYACMQAKLLNE